MSLSSRSRNSRRSLISISCPADGRDRSTVWILTTQCPSQVIAQDPFRPAFGVGALLQIGRLDQLGYCPKVQSALEFAHLSERIVRKGTPAIAIDIFRPLGQSRQLPTWVFLSLHSADLSALWGLGIK